MRTAIKKFCENGKSNGLFLLDMPTGYGKTHSVLDYIYEASLDESNDYKKRKKPIFFITTLKKNLPKDELRERFEKAGQLDKFVEKFLFIDANVEFVIDNLKDELIDDIPREIKQTIEYKSLYRDVKFLQEQKDENKGAMRELYASIKEKLRRDTEPNFRRMLQKMLSNKYKTIEERIHAIKTNEKWKWLGILYPAVFTRDKTIIFMSMDKFLARNSTIVEPSYFFYNSKIIDESVIFIDEFDATKDTMLKNIIENGLRDTINYVELFKEIYSALHTSEFPALLTTPSKKRQEGKYKDQSLQDVINGIQNIADEIYEDYSLQFSHKTSSDVKDSTKKFLFQDHRFITIFDDKKGSYISVKNNSKDRINEILISPDKPNTENNNIQVMLGRIRGFITYFQIGIGILATNYMHLKAERRKDGDDEFTIESAIRSVLAEFRLSKPYEDFITLRILFDSFKKKDDIEDADFDLSFYEKGFRFYSFEDDAVHDMQSKIMMCSFQNTPEKILLRVCEKAKVIGISATASVPTVIGNYDLDYLKSKLKGAFSLPEDADMERFRADFSESLRGYADVHIEAELLGKEVEKNYGVSAWKMVFNNDEIAKETFDIIERDFDDRNSNSNKDYVKERYIRIALAYKRFVQHDDIQSFLCVLTKHPQKGDCDLNISVLDFIFKNIITENNANITGDSYFYQLTGDEYDENKDEITRRLSDGQKLFIISTYQTIGTGQNLQYNIPSGLERELIKINDRSSRNEKDIDAIYLDKPTNLVVNLKRGISEEEFVKYLFHTQFLQERFELSENEAYQHIKRAFECYITGNNNFQDDRKLWSIYRRKSVILLSTRMIIQAIGRLCRTNQKRKNVYIYADSRIADYIDESVLNRRLLNKEFEELLKKFEKQSRKPIIESSIENEAILCSSRANKFIKNFFRDNWNINLMNEWRCLRDLVLKLPTMSDKKYSEIFYAKYFYIKLPTLNNRLFYYEENDYSTVKVGLIREGNLNKEVSEKAARLDILMKFEGLRKYFEENGLATSFKENTYIMCPILFNNIYKGALGEVIGRYLFRKYLNLDLKEIEKPEEFELFDYKLNDNIYIDFKHWRESTVFGDAKMVEKIAKKANMCGAKSVIVANILTENEWDTQANWRYGVKILKVPSLLKMDKNSLMLNVDAWDKIRKCINEFSD